PGWTPQTEQEKRIAYMLFAPPDQALANILQAGLGMADPKLASVLIEDAVETRKALLDWGARFDQQGLRSHGVPIMEAVRGQLHKTDAVVHDRTMISDLLVHDGECVGAVGVDENTGETVVIQAGAVILGTGGDANLFLHNLNPDDTCGDGYVLGYNAGAELTNLEFKQIFLGTVYPTRNMLLQPLPTHVRLMNAREKEFLPDYLPKGATADECLRQRNGHNPFSTRDTLSRYLDIAIVNELRAGRGTDHNAVLLDRTDERIPPLTGPRSEFWAYRGIDFSQPVEISTCHHCSLGGLRIDVNGETTVPHLYAAGEVAAGPHGADRMGGHMLLASQVFGARAGKHAAAFASGQKQRDMPGKVSAQAEERIESLRRGDGASEPEPFRAALHHYAYFKLLVTRSAHSLASFLGDVKGISEELSRFTVTDPGAIIETLELQNLLLLAHIEAEACLMRTESRGPHYREDFPRQNDAEWLRNVVVKKAGDSPQVTTAVIDPSWKDLGDDKIGYWG
ncbi:MAG: hypothetical protein A2147_06315, partial [Chloroflexi bacterium RBG_16_57_8]